MTPAELARRALRLADARGSRVLIGLAGAPGAGKSTVAAAVVAELDVRGALVPMDGFHYSQAVLERLGRAGRKGAPDTFDADGLAALLERLRAASGAVFAPTFDRGIEEPIAAGILVPAEADVILVEGNYLLLDEGPWAALAAIFDETWFLRIPAEVRRERLVARHIAFGRSETDAATWVDTVDEPNARLVEESARSADLLVEPSGAVG